MIHVLLGPADLDDRVQDHLNCLHWRDDLSVGPVPATSALSELSRIRESFWNAPTALKHLYDADTETASGTLRTDDARTKAARLLAAGNESLAERDKRVARLSAESSVVVWCGLNRQEILMLFSLLYFLERAFIEREEVSVVRCPQWGPRAYRADRLAKCFNSRQPISLEFAQLAREGWTTYTRPEPTSMNEFTHRLQEQSNPLATVFSWVLEEYPSLHNGLSRMEECMLREVGEGNSIAQIVGRVMGYSEDCIGDQFLFERMWGFASDQSSAIQMIDGTPLSTVESARAFVQSRVRLTEFGRQLLGAGTDYVAANGLNRWVGGVHLSGRAIPWRYDVKAQRVVST
jgi:hypothetical protein